MKLREKLGDWTDRTADWMRFNTGFMVAVVFVVFMFFILGFMDNDRQLLEDTHNTVENTKIIIENQDKTINEISRSNDILLRRVDDLDEKITCLLADHGQFGVISDESLARCDLLEFEPSSEAMPTDQSNSPPPKENEDESAAEPIPEPSDNGSDNGNIISDVVNFIRGLF